MSLLEAFVRLFLGAAWVGAAPRNDYVSIDRSGRAHFDVASYLASEEGSRHIRQIAEANQRLLRKDATRHP